MIQFENESKTSGRTLIKNKTIKAMEALLVINSILIGISLYFLKDFHSDFKEVSKKVNQMENQINQVAEKLNCHIDKENDNLKKV